MRIFITGGGGHIGSAAIAELTGAGHDVLALVRSDAAANAVEAAGGTVRRGDVNHLDVLAAAASGADAVIHLAFDNSAVVRPGGFEAAAEADLAVVRALADVLAGTNAIFIGIGLAPTGDPDIDARFDVNPRSRDSKEVLAFADRGVRPYLMAIPPVTHSDHDVKGFVPTLISTARSTGISGYINAGSNLWPATHTLDLAHLYRLAVEQAPADPQLHAAVESVRVRQIAESIAQHLGVTTQSFTPEQAPAQFGGFAPIMLMPFPPMSSNDTQKLLDWTPTHASLLEELNAGHYFAATEQTA
jgi:nucleoside-diphosphate-sugar epimerase